MVVGVFGRAGSYLLEKGKSVLGLWELPMEQSESG